MNVNRAISWRGIERPQCGQPQRHGVERLNSVLCDIIDRFFEGHPTWISQDDARPFFNCAERFTTLSASVLVSMGERKDCFQVSLKVSSLGV